MLKETDLRSILTRIDHKGYPAYKDTKGTYAFRGYALSIDHVQGDPFASPSRLHLEIPGKQAGFDTSLFDTPWRRCALEDYLLRRFGEAVRKNSRRSGEAGRDSRPEANRKRMDPEQDAYGQQDSGYGTYHTQNAGRRDGSRSAYADRTGETWERGSGKSGIIEVSRPGQEVLVRAAVTIHADGALTVRFRVGFPARGRTILAEPLMRILFDFLPRCVEKTLVAGAYRAEDLREIADLADDRHFIREELPKRGLVAFVADGAVLPRASGVSDLPMKDAIPFRAPEECAVTLTLPHRGALRGMGIAEGITLIVGGGYHGKSTLLKALERGVYDHIAGDGREYVITDDSAVKLRAEDGRSIQNTDISMFIRDLPNGKQTERFSTEDASGSTSQAANTVEALEAGARVLLIDEDTSATNFMIRDALMQRVVHPEEEPIIPFIDRVEGLSRDGGISTILVAGSSGSYFYKADHVIRMREYLPYDITAHAKAEAYAVAEGADAGAGYTAEGQADAGAGQTAERQADVGAGRTAEGPADAGAGHTAEGQADVKGTGRENGESTGMPLSADDIGKHRILRAGMHLRPQDRIKTKGFGTDGFSLNHETVELRFVEQLVDAEQSDALAQILVYFLLKGADGKHTLRECVDALFARIAREGFAAFDAGSGDHYAMPRRQEVYAMLNRVRHAVRIG